MIPLDPFQEPPSPCYPMKSNALRAALALLLAGTISSSALGQTATPTPTPLPTTGANGPTSILLTIFLRHDQTKTLDEIQAHVDKTGFRRTFPPEGTEIVGWYVMMGIGQVIILSVPPDKLRAVNVAIERGAWGAYRSEFYPTYDYLPVYKEQRDKALATHSK